MEKIDQLGIKLRDDGYVELEQDLGCGETATVYLHPIHIRYLFEKVGFVKSVPADALTKRLAWWLVTAQQALCEEYGLSPKIDSLLAKLNVVVSDVIPDDAFPYELFEDEKKPQAEAPAPAKTERPAFDLTHTA